MHVWRRLLWIEPDLRHVIDSHEIRQRPGHPDCPGTYVRHGALPATEGRITRCRAGRGRWIPVRGRVLEPHLSRGPTDGHEVTMIQPSAISQGQSDVAWRVPPRSGRACTSPRPAAPARRGPSPQAGPQQELLPPRELLHRRNQPQHETIHRLHRRTRPAHASPTPARTISGHSSQSRNTSPGRRGASPDDANPETGAEAPTAGRPGAGDSVPSTLVPPPVAAPPTAPQGVPVAGTSAARPPTAAAPLPTRRPDSPSPEPPATTASSESPHAYGGRTSRPRHPGPGPAAPAESHAAPRQHRRRHGCWTACSITRTCCSAGRGAGAPRSRQPCVHRTP